MGGDLLGRFHLTSQGVKWRLCFVQINDLSGSIKGKDYFGKLFFL